MLYAIISVDRRFYVETFMVDLDEVITKGGMLYLINQFLGTEYKEEDFTDYYMQNVIPKEYQEDFWNYFFSKNLYDYCTIEPHAYEVLEESKEY